MTPLITVVIPAFNRPSELDRALNSLVLQTYKNFNVIVVDDGSEVDLSQVINGYLHKLNLVYVKIPNSGGPARPRNAAIKLSQSEWISFLDSDDWWRSDRLKRVASFISQFPNIDVFYHKLKIHLESGPAKWRLNNSLGENLPSNTFVSLMLYGDLIPNSSVVVKKRCFEKYGYLNESQEYQSVEDFDYWLLLARNGCKFKFIPRALGFYSLGPAGISSNANKTIKRNHLILMKYVPYLNPQNQVMAICKYFYLAGSISFVNKNYLRSLVYFRRAKKLASLNLRTKRLGKMVLAYFHLYG